MCATEVTTPIKRLPQQGKGNGLAAIAAPGARDEPVSSSMNTVKTIMGGPEYDDAYNQQNKYLRAVSHEKIAQSINLTYVPPPSVRFESIYFTKLEAKRVLHPYNDARVVTTTIVNNIVRCVLIDNGSVVDIIFKSAFDCMKLDGVRPAPVKTPHLRVLGGEGLDRVLH